MKKVTKSTKPTKSIAKVKSKKLIRQVMGVTASIKNIIIAVALLFGFVGGIFQIYSWVDTTYARQMYLKQEVEERKRLLAQEVEERKRLETKHDFKCEGDILNGWYLRFYTLDQIRLTSPSGLPAILLAEYNKLKVEIPKQENLVRILQERLLLGK